MMRLLIIACVIIFSDSAQACMCLPASFRDFETIDSYEELFMGKLVDVELSKNFAVNDMDTFPAEIDKYLITKVYFGDFSVGDTINIYQFGIGCVNTKRFDEVGTPYIIGAYRLSKDEAIPGIESYLQGNLCTLSIAHDDEPNYSLAQKSLDFRLNYFTTSVIQHYTVIGLVVSSIIGAIVFTLFKTDIKY